MSDRSPDPRLRHSLATLFSLVLLTAQTTATATTAAAELPHPETVLTRALENQNPSRRERVRLTNYRKKRKGVEREIELWVKNTGEEVKVLGTFAGPQEIRGTSFLSVPSADATAEADRIPPNQYFIYLPALRNTRRISGAQRADAFFGTHLSQGDVEPHPPHHYRALAVRAAIHQGEPVFVLTVEPLFDAGYDRLVLHVARRDHAILKYAQYDARRELPMRTIETRRDWLEIVGGHVLPTRLVASGGRRGGSTQIEFLERELEPEISDEFFSMSTLLRRGR